LRRSARAGAADHRQADDWAPVADVIETDSEYLIKAELPEVRKEDGNISVQDGVLTLTGERKQEKSTDNEKVHRVERSYGSFVRRFSLPNNVDETGIRAESKDGVLVIHLPKQKAEQPEARQIAVD
jgi:HSP20 family protein